MEDEEQERIREVCRRVEKVLRYSRDRWIDLDNEFWLDFRLFMRYKVKSLSRKNPWLFAPCCWTFCKRSNGKYNTSHIYSKLNYYLTKNTVFWTYFVQIATESGWCKEGQLMLPSIGSDHFEKWEEPANDNKSRQPSLKWDTQWPTPKTTTMHSPTLGLRSPQLSNGTVAE